MILIETLDVEIFLTLLTSEIRSLLISAETSFSLHIVIDAYISITINIKHHHKLMKIFLDTTLQFCCSSDIIKMQFIPLTSIFYK